MARDAFSSPLQEPMHDRAFFVGSWGFQGVCSWTVWSGLEQPGDGYNGNAIATQGSSSAGADM